MVEAKKMSREADRKHADKRLQDLLVKTSRTFALAIPQLPQPTLREVTIAYLLFRIADPLEDASVLWSRDQQLEALREFDRLMRRPTAEEAQVLAERWLQSPPSDHSGYNELLAQNGFVIEHFLALGEPSRETIALHTPRTARLMADFVTKSDERGVLRLGDLSDLREYCYAVAGIVGEMLTELFVLGSDLLAPRAGYLRQRAAAFGEGLQLVNILKDSAADAVEGRNYLPADVDRSEVFSLARADLTAATEYSLAIQEAGGADGVVAFTALPVELAWATLEKVEREGPGAKITRAEVFGSACLTSSGTTCSATPPPVASFLMSLVRLSSAAAFDSSSAGRYFFSSRDGLRRNDESGRTWVLKRPGPRASRRTSKKRKMSASTGPGSVWPLPGNSV